MNTQTIKKCSFCNEDIDAKAKRCPKCHADLRSWISRHPVITVFLLIIFVPLIVSSIINGFSGNSNSVPQTSAVPNTGNNAQQVNQKNVEIIDVSTKVVETNEVWWKFAWILKLKNNTNEDQTVTAELKWTDKNDYVVDSHTEYNLTVPAGQEKTFNDYMLINTTPARTVKNIEVHINNSPF
jgi:hypothetical protein